MQNHVFPNLKCHEKHYDIMLDNRTQEKLKPAVSKQRITGKKESDAMHLAEAKCIAMYKVEALLKQVRT